VAGRKAAPKKQAPRDEFVDGLDNEEGQIDSRKWEFEEGDRLVGIVVDTYEADGEYGPYTGYVVEPEPEHTTEAGGDSSAVSKDDPLVWYVNDNSAAARSIPRAGIEVGDRLGVKYVGIETAKKSGREFKKFNVKVEKADAASV
jgi:hypothetical protein